VNEWLRAYAARSGGRCEFYEPGREVMQWAAGSSYFEVVRVRVRVRVRIRVRVPDPSPNP